MAVVVGVREMKFMLEGVFWARKVLVLGVWVLYLFMLGLYVV